MICDLCRLGIPHSDADCRPAPGAVPSDDWTWLNGAVAVSADIGLQQRSEAREQALRQLASVSQQVRSLLGLSHGEDDLIWEQRNPGIRNDPALRPAWKYSTP